jgi:hypothetical protein
MHPIVGSAQHGLKQTHNDKNNPSVLFTPHHQPPKSPRQITQSVSLVDIQNYNENGPTWANKDAVNALRPTKAP